MRKLLALFLPLLLVACNGPSELPALQGKIINHTNYPMSAIEISVSYSCKNPQFIGPGESCGYQTQKATPSADGSYRFEAMKLSAGLDYEYRLGFTVRIKDGTDNTLMEKNRYAVFDLFGSEINKKLENLKNFTLFKLEEQKIQYVLASGKSSSAWAREEGRDSFLEMTFDFGQKVSSFSHTHEREGLWSENTETIPAALLVVPGEYAADASVTVKTEMRNSDLVKNGYLLKQELTVNFSPELPEVARRLVIDDTNFPTPSRSISGSWDVSLNFNRSYAAGKEHNMYDGKALMECVNGRIQGTISLVNRPASPRKFDGTLALRGSCEGERGQAEFDFQYANDVKEETVRFAWSRVGGNARVLLSKDVDSFSRFQGHDYTAQMLLLDGSGKVGDIRATKSKQ